MSTKNRKRQVITISKRSKTSNEKKRRMLSKRHTKTKNTQNPTIIKKTKTKTKSQMPVNEKVVEKKKLVRKERNRINARRFRERRKVYVDTLEKETKELKEENTSLTNELTKVQKQNLELLALIEELKKNGNATGPIVQPTPMAEEKEVEQTQEIVQEKVQEQEQEPEQEQEKEQEKEESEGVLSANDIYEIESPLPSDNFYEDLEVNLQSAIQDFQRSEMFQNDFDFPTEQQYIYDQQNEKQNSQWANLTENSSYEQNIFSSKFL
ncbi:cyclic-amp response element binding protein [Anaeramoeba flamelloides]|uniref:Cyclic-amp response element binding protein n=1 Tax=Anaeramoeba flamelloides TaxID=1746091 RepID=A0AAV7ZD82_9EUKA|nr:cyclic-amp response element binding protein [Anaeramoeba flamelloides]